MIRRNVVFFLLAAAALGVLPRQCVAQPRKEIRGVWISPGFFGPERTRAIRKIKETLDEYLASGINTLMVMVKSTSGLVYYESEIAPKDSAWDWDFFGTILEEARARKMTVHPWFCVFTEGARAGTVGRHPEWLIRDRQSQTAGVVNPALPEVRQYEKGLMLELAKRYPVAWIHLDYIRFPSSPRENYYSFDSLTRRAFTEYSGTDPDSIKATDSGNILWNEWISWNRGHVTEFVRELREALRGVPRPVKISAAVFPDAEHAKVLVGQDWKKWAAEGLVDMLCPMLYTNNDSFFEEYTRQAARISHASHARLCIGVGIGTSHNQNTPPGMLRQMEISRRLGADGVIFFSAGSLNDEFLKVLGTQK
jgi:uncharacterized lipoprotein YddW (UPF0748 family)